MFAMIVPPLVCLIILNQLENWHMLCFVGWLVELQGTIDYVCYDYASIGLPHYFELVGKVVVALMC